MGNDLTILYLEDNPEILENMTFLLERYVQKVYTAEDGEEALRLFNEHSPDILVLDIMVPKITGLELAQIVREKNQKVPIVFLTAFNDDEKLSIAKSIPASSFIQKPFNLETLNMAITKAINEQLS